jgi:glycosyltransferase involved in cell wall biosynthesis
MRIAIVTHQFFPAFYTGVERLTLNLAAQLRRMAHECVVITSAEHASGDEQAYDYEGTSVRPIRTGRVDLARPWAQDPGVGPRLGAALDEEAVDLVHVMQPMRLPQVFAEASRRGLPLVVHMTDFSYLCTRVTMLRPNGAICPGADDGRACVSVCGVRPGPERVRWARSVLDHAAAVVSPCRFTTGVHGANGFDTAGWRDVPWGVDFALHPRRLPAPAGERLVLGFVGTLLHHKGPHVVVDALRRLPTASLELHLYGESFHERAYGRELRRLVADDPRIRFKGAYDHAEFGRILASLDAVVIPSLWHENLPTTGLNAIASGVPLIVSDVGGLRELIDDYRCGLTFRVGDAASLAELLGRLLEDRSVLSGLRQRMAYPPSLETEAWRLEGIYESALGVEERRAGQLGSC